MRVDFLIDVTVAVSVKMFKFPLDCSHLSPVNSWQWHRYHRIRYLLVDLRMGSVIIDRNIVSITAMFAGVADNGKDRYREAESARQD